VRSGFFVGKILDKFRFVVRTSVLKIRLECHRALRPTDRKNCDIFLEYNLTGYKICDSLGLSQFILVIQEH